MFLAYAIDQAGCAGASDVAEYIKSGKVFDGVAGNITFSENGDAVRSFAVQLISKGAAGEYIEVDKDRKKSKKSETK